MSRYERHNAQARETIKNSFLAVLETKSYEQISMADVARQANMSRSTVYAHFSHLQALFEACTQDFLAESRSLKTQLSVQECSDCSEHTLGRPFCETIRNAGKYQLLVKDPHFFPTAMQLFSQSENSEHIVNDYIAMGVDPRQAHFLALFQLSGCFAVASNKNTTGDWSEVRKTLDAFIRGGINEVRAKKL